MIRSKVEALRSFEQDIDANIRLVVSENEHIIIDLNVQNQLYERGVDRNDISIIEYRPYAQRTVAFKRLLGHPFDRVTLRDTGDFHRSFRLQIYSDCFEIVATDIKTEMLIAKYGDSILGLTDANLNEFIWEYVYEFLLNTLIDNLR